MKSSLLAKEILTIVRNIEKEQNRENRHDRLKSFERSMELILGRIEKLEERQEARDRYDGVEYIKEAKYKKL